MTSEPLQNNGAPAARQRTNAEIRARAQQLMEEQNARLGLGAKAVSSEPKKKATKAESGAPIGVYVFGLVFSGFLAVSAISGYSELQLATANAQQAADAKIEAESVRSANLLSQWIEGSMAPTRAAVASSDLASMDVLRGERFLVNMGKTQRQIKAFALVSQDGQQVARSDDNPKLNNIDRAFYKIGITGKETYNFEVSKTNGLPSLFSGVPVVDDGAKVLGVLMSNSDLKTASDKVFPKFGKTGSTVLVDEQNKVLYADDKELLGATLPDVSGTVAHDVKIPRVVSMTKKTLDGRYAIVSMIDEVEAREPVERVKDAVIFNLAVGLAGSLAISLILGFIASRSMRAIASLVEEASRAASVEKLVEIEGALDKSAKASEVRMLARSIKRLISSIKIAILTRKA